MSHRHKNNHHRRISKSREWLKKHDDALQDSARSARPKLEFVLKCGSAGSLEAVASGVSKIVRPGVDISIIKSGVGGINHSDVLMAKTGSGLIAGFQTGVLPGIEKDLDEHAVEVRLYSVIYKLTDDIQKIAESMLPSVPEEEITGTARIIDLFKSTRKGIIIGCEVLDGYLSTGRRFRIISAMGPVHSGTIESMHMEKDTVQKAATGQQVGIKIEKFNKAKIGDVVECFRPALLTKSSVWQPTGEIIRIP